MASLPEQGGMPIAGSRIAFTALITDAEKAGVGVKPVGVKGPVSQNTASLVRAEMRGASMACSTLMPWSSRLLVICTTALMIFAPPAEPTAANALPSFSSSVGVMLLRGRL